MAEALPSQQLISVNEIREGTLVVKGGGLRKVLLAGGVNFELKSEEEQGVLIGGFQELLASLDFSFQVVVHSRKINIDEYLSKVEESAEKEPNELLKIQTQEYINFVRSFTETYSVMEKKFFVVVPYDLIELTKETVRAGFGRLLKRQAPSLMMEALSPEDFSRHQAQLLTRQEQVMGGLARLGINAIALGTEELIELIYNLFNPAEKEKRGIAFSKND
ncbi:MAG: hypothetical protein HYW80_01170 [Parcubacteria group bacterium]|nr:hypothetical protein [Parcubacteria group bacterium]